MNRLALLLGLALAVFGHADVSALNLSLSRTDMERAITFGSSSDPDRARFHNPYVILVDGTKLDYITVERIEVISEFRRLVLIAEQQVGLNNSFGRGGVRDVEEALRPWRGQLSIVAYLRFDTVNRVIAVLPAVAIVLDGTRDILPTEIRPAALPGRGTPPGERLEAIFDARSVGQASHYVVLRYKGGELARVPIDFGQLE